MDAVVVRTITSTLTALTCACALVALGASSAHAEGRSQYWFDGRGWGHGVGMSQYGANGFAAQGWSHGRIIRHYFRGTVVAPRPSSSPGSVRVLLRRGLMQGRVEATSAGSVRQAGHRLQLQAGDVVELRASGATLVATRVRAGAPDAVVAAGSDADVVIVPAVDASLRTLFRNDRGQTGTTYRGTIVGHLEAGRVAVVNVVGLESYLRGVVPREMSPSWRPAALRAQSVAARSYALTRRPPPAAWFDVYSDTRSQVYDGADAEAAATDSAVAATSGQVARVGSTTGPVAETFFFSTSAGRTAANEEVFGGVPRSHLRSVASPYEGESPYRVWRGADVRRLTPTQLAAQLGLAGAARSARARLHPSGYVADLTVTTSTGSTATVEGPDVRFALQPALRSSFFRVRFLSIAAPDTARRGTFARLTGRAPRGGTTYLVLRRDGVAKAVPLTTAGPLGTWTVRTRMTGDLTASLLRAGLAGPRIVVKSVD